MADSSHRRGRDETSSHKRRSLESESAEVPAKKPSIGFNFKSGSKSTPKFNVQKIGSSKKPSHNPIAIKLARGPQKVEPPVVKKSSKVAAVFNEDSDSETEEIPPEAKMRMKNIGRNTPTSAGPNSFNKGKLGFCDAQRYWEKKQEEIAKQHLQKEEN